MGIMVYPNRIKDKLDRDTRILVVQSLALGIVNYCSTIWGSAGVTQVKRVQKLQNFAAKVACGGKKFEHATPYVNSLNWLKIDSKCKFDICLLMFKLLNNCMPDWLLDFSTVGEVNSRITRQQNNLFVPRTRTLTGERGLVVRGCTLWNNIPGNIKHQYCIVTFKRELKKHFLLNQL